MYYIFLMCCLIAVVLNLSRLVSSKCSHIPHVMTLFDRRVDLARFTLDTPLYVMCREWMSNNPQKAVALAATGSFHDNHQPLTSKPHLHLHPNTLPLPTPLGRDADGRPIRLDIPKPHPPHTKTKEELDKVLREVIN